MTKMSSYSFSVFIYLFIYLSIHPSIHIHIKTGLCTLKYFIISFCDSRVKKHIGDFIYMWLAICAFIYLPPYCHCTVLYS